MCRFDRLCFGLCMGWCACLNAASFVWIADILVDVLLWLGLILGLIIVVRF